MPKSPTTNVTEIGEVKFIPKTTCWRQKTFTKNTESAQYSIEVDSSHISRLSNNSQITFNIIAFKT